MSDLSAVVFVPDDTAKTGFSRPMMLQAIMGTPLLSWLTRSLAAGGVGRFFLVCHERYRDAALGCFPDPGRVSLSHSEDAPDLLHLFQKPYRNRIPPAHDKPGKQRCRALFLLHSKRLQARLRKRGPEH